MDVDIQKNSTEMLAAMIDQASNLARSSHRISSRKKIAEAQARAISTLHTRGETAPAMPVCPACMHDMQILSATGYELDFVCKNCRGRRLYATTRDSSFY